MIKNNEPVYDKQIAPMMKKIIAICKEHKLPMFATFIIGPDSQENNLCTTALPAKRFYPEISKDSPVNQLCTDLYRRTYHGPPGQFAAITIITK